ADPFRHVGIVVCGRDARTHGASQEPGAAMAGIWSGDFRMHGGIAHRNSPAGLSRPTKEWCKWRCGASWRRAVRPSIAWVARIELPQQRRAGARPAKVGGDVRDRGIADHALWLAPRGRRLGAGLARAAENSTYFRVDWRSSRSGRRETRASWDGSYVCARRKSPPCLFKKPAAKWQELVRKIGIKAGPAPTAVVR